MPAARYPRPATRNTQHAAGCPQPQPFGSLLEPSSLMHSAHDEEKWRAYPNTLLEFPECDAAPIDLRRPLEQSDRDLLRDLGLDQPFAVITAENPCGLNAEDANDERQAEIREQRNRERTRHLGSMLDARDAHFIRVDGVSPDGVYREESVAVNLERKEAIDLARELDQLAIFWYDGHDFWLYPAELEEKPVRLPVAESSAQLVDN